MLVILLEKQIKMRTDKIFRWCERVTKGFTVEDNYKRDESLSDKLTRLERKIDCLLFMLSFVLLCRIVGFISGITIALLDVLVNGIH